jgi:hypothetical protein
MKLDDTVSEDRGPEREIARARACAYIWAVFTLREDLKRQ